MTPTKAEGNICVRFVRLRMEIVAGTVPIETNPLKANEKIGLSFALALTITVAITSYIPVCVI